MLQLQPALEEWQKNYNFQLVIVSSDSMDEMNSFVSKRNIKGLVLMDSKGTTSRQYQVKAIPTDFLFDEKGQIRESFVGWRGSSSLNQIETWLQNP